MRKTIIAIAAAMMLPLALFADGYKQLWKQYEQAQKKDLPQSQMQILDNIATQARREKSYGNLLNAEVKRLTLSTRLSGDSLKPAMKLMEQRAEAAEKTDKALAAVYDCVIADAYFMVQYKSDFRDGAAKSKEYYAKALANPQLLASVKAPSYEPFVKNGRDGEIFCNDLLSIIGYKAKAYAMLNRFYDNAGNRRAALVTALDKLADENMYSGNYSSATSQKIGRKYLQQLDSLINLYGDLSECGEAAITRYRIMNGLKNVGAAEKAEFIGNAMKKWASWRNIGRLKSEYEALIQPSFDVTISNTLLPDHKDSVKVLARNVRNITLAVTRLNLSGNTNLSADNGEDWKKLKSLLIPSSRIEVKTPVEFVNEYDKKEQYIALPKMKPGLYVVEVSVDNKDLKIQRLLVSVSDVFLARIYLPKGNVRFAVLSATTGQPLPGAKIETWYGNKKHSVLTADENGEAIGSARASDYDVVRAYTEADNYMQKVSAWGNFTNYGNKRLLHNVQVFTDRAIYRPGQTVHVSALAYDVDGLHSSKTVGGKELTLTLYNANSKVVEEKKVVTDDFGTASADFTLPESGMNGTFYVKASGNSYGNANFRVEEYKRPTFDVTLDDVNTEYHNGDTVKVTGYAKSFAGIPVQGGRVAYSVKRSLSRLFFSYVNSSAIDKVMLTDTVATDADGRFEIRIPVVMPEGYEENAEDDNAISWKCPWRFYRFTADVQVTDNGGESHSAETTLTLGNRPTALSLDMADKVLRDSVLTMTINRYNASGKKIDGTVKYWFDTPTDSYTAKVNKSISINWKEYKGLESGRHTLYAVCGADTISREFVLFGLDDKRPADDTPDWAYLSAQTFPRDGSPVYVQVGSSCEDTRILYSVIADNKEIESGSYEVNNGIKTIPYIYKEEYGEGLLLNFLWVKDGVAYTHKYTIARPLEDKTLELKWVTFRDKLTPGQKETWTLNVSRPKITDVINKQSGAEDNRSQLLALMYDKSLDMIAKNRFSFNLQRWQNLPSTRWSTASAISLSLNAMKDIKWVQIVPFEFNTFDYSLADLLYSSLDYMAIGAYPEAAGSRPLHIRGYGRVLKTTAVKSESVREEVGYSSNFANSDESASMKEKSADGAANDEALDGGNEDIVAQVRENLQETAFFYPALYADKEGNVKIEFTLPESVTTWRFRGFAHDKNMNYGLLESDVVASKKVMVMPNVPRFVRTDDKATIATRVANTTEKDITTNVVLQMLDPVSDKVVYSESKKLKIDANTTKSVSFNYSADGKNSLLVCRISAEGNGYSDGEQHYLPVLPNVERVVNTVPFTFLQKGEKQIKLDELFPKSADNKRLTVEYTANPTWLMVQALPYISQTDEKNAISLVSAYYANKIGQYIMNQTPVIRKVVDLWKKGNNKESGSLMSALQKNQELKTLVLEETPWVMDADREEDMKQMLTTFFDESAMAYRLSSQFKSLSELQNADGSWSWWRGMKGSPSMTAQVVETLVRLKLMTANSQADAVIKNAMSYLGNIVVDEYNKIRKAEKNGEPFYICDSHAIQYLYINALLNRELPSAEKPMKDYLLTYLRKDRQRNIYAKALMATVLYKEGEIKEAKEYVESIRQYTVSKPEMGTYFDTHRAAYSWVDYRIPTQTAAIEALKAVEPNDTKTIKDMRLWLLQSKRTQAWDTPINSVNAIYAFLDGNYKTLSVDNVSSMALTVDGKNKNLPQVSEGLGYTKVAFDVDRQNTVTVKKSSEGTSWGAAYAEFLQPTAEVEATGSGLKVVREVVGGSRQFAVGDRVTVRLTITADRDYDFVQIVDKRAACMEPVNQVSGYGYGYYRVAKDNATNFYFDRMSKGTHVVEADYYIDRQGEYASGTCTVQCAYAPEYYGRAAGEKWTVEK